MIRFVYTVFQCGPTFRCQPSSYLCRGFPPSRLLQHPRVLYFVESSILLRATCFWLQLNYFARAACNALGMHGKYRLIQMWIY